jgi:hypothetical protein
MTTPQPQITLYFLNASRAIRVAWMLEALSLPYSLVRAERASNGLAPPEFRAKIPGSLRKSPTITDGSPSAGGVVLQESGAIIEYLCETYDQDGQFLPKDARQRSKVQEWLSASEGTFLMHGIAVSSVVVSQFPYTPMVFCAFPFFSLLHICPKNAMSFPNHHIPPPANPTIQNTPRSCTRAPVSPRRSPTAPKPGRR